MLSFIYANPPYITKRFPSRTSGPYSLHNLGTLSVKPNWIGLKYKVNPLAIYRLKTLMHI
jgi:hypothetical protein